MVDLVILPESYRVPLQIRRASIALNPRLNAYEDEMDYTRIIIWQAVDSPRLRPQKPNGNFGPEGASRLKRQGRRDCTGEVMEGFAGLQQDFERDRLSARRSMELGMQSR